METLLDGGFPYIVAEDGGDIAGYAYAGPYRPRIAYRFTLEDSIYLAPAHQRKGIGNRAAWPALLAESEQRGFRQMIAVIGDSANDGLDRACNTRRLRDDRHLPTSDRLQIRPLARSRC